MINRNCFGGSAACASDQTIHGATKTNTKWSTANEPLRRTPP